MQHNWYVTNHSHSVCRTQPVCRLVSSQSVSCSHSVWSSVCRAVCQSVLSRTLYHQQRIARTADVALSLDLSHTHRVAFSVSQLSIAQSVILSYHKQSIVCTLSLCLTKRVSVWNSLCLLLYHARCCSTTDSLRHWGLLLLMPHLSRVVVWYYRMAEYTLTAVAKTRVLMELRSRTCRHQSSTNAQTNTGSHLDSRRLRAHRWVDKKRDKSSSTDHVQPWSNLQIRIVSPSINKSKLRPWFGILRRLRARTWADRKRDRSS